MRVIVTGSNGLLGQNLCQLIIQNTQHQCIGLSQNANKQIGLFAYESVDITDQSPLSYYIERYAPDAIIHTAALSKPDVCEQNPELCWRINVEATQSIAQLCKKQSIHLVHLSSDFIFDGLAPFYNEEAIPQPVSVYGRSKAEGENIIMNELPEASIVRTSLVYGTVADASRSNFALWVVNNLRQKKVIRVCNDQFRTPTWVGDLASACLQLAERRMAGIFNIAGSELYSVYEIARHVAWCFGLDESLIVPVATVELNEPARRPVKTHLLIHKAQTQLDYKPSELQHGLQHFKNCCTNV